MVDGLRRSARLSATQAKRPVETTSKRPSRLLNTKWNPKNTIATRNATQSPLLRLPPEIRNRIYGYALGGSEIHVHLFEKALQISICCLEESEETHISKVRHAQNEQQIDAFIERHHDCTCMCAGEEKQNLDLGLLMVCRQIHNEASLLVFSNNTFIIDREHAMKLWQASLIPVQLRAVRSIILHFVKPYRKPLMATAAKRLPDLEYFGALFEMEAYRYLDQTKEEVVRYVADIVLNQGWSWQTVTAKAAKVAMVFLPFDDKRVDLDYFYTDAFDALPAWTDNACTSAENMATSGQ